MKVFILGSQGFIGFHLVHYFLNNSHNVFGCDLIEYATNEYNYQKISIHSADFETLFTNESFDVCINASGSGNVPFSMSHPLSDFEANTSAVAKVLDTIRKYQPSCKYVHISSAAVYGNPSRLPISESDALAPLSPYGFHKWMSELLCREYYELHHLPTAIIRPFSVYGEGLKKQLLWDICQKLHQNKSISLFGSGKETRDFIHISDLVELIVKIIENSAFKCDIYNAATGTETSIRKIANLFEWNFPGERQISFSGEVREGDPLNWRADVAKFAEVDFQPKVILEDAIIEYINWYCSLAHE